MVVTAMSGLVSALVIVVGFQLYRYMIKRRASVTSVFLGGFVEGLVLCYGLQVVTGGVDTNLTTFCLGVSFFLACFIATVYRFERN